jgi:hypothetical protein
MSQVVADKDISVLREGCIALREDSLIRYAEFLDGARHLDMTARIAGISKV